MRVISGIRRGIKLIDFDGEYIRPTTDRVKEAMFNLIQGSTADAVVYDAFAGSGGLGIEAVSRGAKFVYCTDTDERSIQIIRKNYEGCDFSDKCGIYKTAATDFLEKTDRLFDLVFMDPPYNKNLVTPALEVIARRKLLTPCGLVVVETDGIEDTFDFSGFNLEKQRKYGRTVISVLSLQQKEV